MDACVLVVVVVLGSGASRVSRVSDLWRPRFGKPYPPTHPYYVNLVGTQNLIKAAKEKGLAKIVRITGLSGRSAPTHHHRLLEAAPGGGGGGADGRVVCGVAWLVGWWQWGTLRSTRSPCC